jgi:hypothetical protein
MTGSPVTAGNSSGRSSGGKVGAEVADGNGVGLVVVAVVEGETGLSGLVTVAIGSGAVGSVDGAAQAVENNSTQMTRIFFTSPIPRLQLGSRGSAAGLYGSE